MMRRGKGSAICCLLLSATALRAATVDEVLGKLEKAGAVLKTYAADFERERVYVIAEDRDHDSGRFYYDRSGKMLWAFGAPSERTVLIEPGRVSIYEPKIKQLTTTNLGQSHGEFQIIGFGGSRKGITEKYTVKLLDEDSAAWHIELVPRSVEDSLFGKIEMWVDKKIALPSAMKFYEKTTDETTVHFRNPQINPALPSSRFKLAVPAGTSVIQ